MPTRFDSGTATLKRHLLTAAPLFALFAAVAFLTGCADGNLIDLVSGGYGLSCCGLILVILDILAIIEIVKSGREVLNKALWIALIVFFPFGGLILYYFFGK